MERDSFAIFEIASEENFNSHAHVERDQNDSSYFCQWLISTHTLTWSVTLDAIAWALGGDISTHTLTWSVTFPDDIDNAGKAISTHTLTWSVTVTDNVSLAVAAISTHTLTWSVTCKEKVR